MELNKSHWCAFNFTLQTIGICGDEFYLSSTCVVRVQPTWYRNGSRFNHRADDNYLLLGSGELRILNLTEATVGYYACVLSVNALGGESYQTQKENITLALPSKWCGQLTSKKIDVLLNGDLPMWGRCVALIREAYYAFLNLRCAQRSEN